MKRRQFMAGAAVVPLAALVRPDALPPRKATFEEVGSSVLLTIDLPGLFRKYDDEALQSIDSGFDTTLHVLLTVWEYGARHKMAQRSLVRKIRRDPWKKKYVVSTRTERGWSKRTFDERDDAVAYAVSLQRVRIASTSDLERGERGPYYFVEVLALRNPITPRQAPATRGSSARSRGRDLEWFGRLVEVFAGERALAEEVVHIRSNHFYLVPR